jgi:hypothetical protein
MPRDRKKRNEQYMRRWRKDRREAIAMFGDACFFCGSTERRMEFHRKDGVSHSNSNTAKLVLKAPDEWMYICRRCHLAVHWMMTELKLTWHDIEFILSIGRY